MAAIKAATIVIALEIDSGIRVQLVMRPICSWHPEDSMTRASFQVNRSSIRKQAKISNLIHVLN
jgi:hypothetical protein